MYTDNKKSTRERILQDMFSIVRSVLPTSSYAFKGGYMLKTILNSSAKTRNIRHTTDLDIDISSEEYFDKIVDSLKPYLESLKSAGVIYSYMFKRPQIKGTRNISGSVRLYRKGSENTKKYVFCGIDIGVHPLFYGIVQMVDGTNVYSLERSLADKFCAMYFQEEKGILHRAKDIMDLFLIQQYLTEQSVQLNFKLILFSIHSKLEDMRLSALPDVSSLERIYVYKKTALVDAVKQTIMSERIQEELLDYSSASDIIKSAISFVNVLRGKYNGFYK